MMHFFLAMVNHPDVQQKAWAELDAVVGPDHLPTFEDRDSLPYINAIVKETMRWHSIVPLGIAHLISEDVYYKNYCLPKGAVLIPNNWYAGLSVLYSCRSMMFDSQVNVSRSVCVFRS